VSNKRIRQASLVEPKEPSITMRRLSLENVDGTNSAAEVQLQRRSAFVMPD